MKLSVIIHRDLAEYMVAKATSLHLRTKPAFDEGEHKEVRAHWSILSRYMLLQSASSFDLSLYGQLYR
jgi:hypothetical protein